MKPITSKRVKRIHFVGTKVRSSSRSCSGGSCRHSNNANCVNEAHDEA